MVSQEKQMEVLGLWALNSGFQGIHSHSPDTPLDQTGIAWVIF